MRPETETERRLLARIAALGRPQVAFGGLSQLRRALEAAREWDCANPEAAAEYRALSAALEAETSRADRAEAEEIATGRALRASAWRLEASGVGDRASAAAVAPRPTEALEAVRRWMAADCAWLVLCGTKGTGKSVAATWAVREVVRGGDCAAFRRVASLARLSQFDAGAVEFRALATAHLLVLDDFGAELLTDYARAQLFELLDERHENLGRTIITSNLPWKHGEASVVARLGERLVDRIEQSGRVVQLTPAHSLRKQTREVAR